MAFMGMGIRRSFWLFGYSPLRVTEIRSYRNGVESCWRHLCLGLYVRTRAVYIPQQLAESLKSIEQRGTQIQVWSEQDDDAR